MDTLSFNEFLDYITEEFNNLKNVFRGIMEMFRGIMDSFMDVFDRVWGWLTKDTKDWGWLTKDTKDWGCAPKVYGISLIRRTNRIINKYHYIPIARRNQPYHRRCY